MKASPLLRAWLQRLDALGVRVVTRAHWRGWDAAGALIFADGARHRADAVVLALGGASWPRLGSDGSWTQHLAPQADITPLRPANCGFAVAWSAMFRDRYAGTPLKPVVLSFADETVRGEAMISAQGIEGGAVYALSAPLRDAIVRDGVAELTLDLRPDLSSDQLAERLDGPRGGLSLSNFLRKRAGLSPVAIGLVQEALHGGAAASLSRLVKAMILRLDAPFDLTRAISTAGGVTLGALDDRLMLRDRPGLFAAGEMLDWEAPTGQGVLDWLHVADRRA
jgi:hypothetical protein